MSSRLLARGVRGLEWVLAEEVAARVPSARKIRLAPREVRFTVSEPDTVAVPRTADDLFLVVGRTPDLGRPKEAAARMATALAAADWAEPLAQLRGLRPVPAGDRFDVVASFAGKRNFNRYALEDALGALLARPLGLTYQSRTPAGPGPLTLDPVAVTVRVFLDGVTATAALRLGPRPAHRRDYKQDTGPGTLHPPLAAALARLAGVSAGARVLDPFCGDGTIAIEAALAQPGALVLGADRDPERLGNARANADRAGARIAWQRADAGAPPIAPGGVDALLTNPPWNLAVAAAGTLRDSLAPFWRSVPELLAPGGTLCAVADEELDAPHHLRDNGMRLALEIRVRLAGRLSRVVLAGTREPGLSPGLARWRETAHRAGIVGDADF